MVGIVETGGDAGIRTLGTGVSPYNGLANRRIRPLCHLSGGAELQFITFGMSALTASSHTFTCLLAHCPIHLLTFTVALGPSVRGVGATQTTG